MIRPRARAVAGRAVVCERLTMLPVECVARGYSPGRMVGVFGVGSVCGVGLPEGLVDGSRLPEPISPGDQGRALASMTNHRLATVAAMVVRMPPSAYGR